MRAVLRLVRTVEAGHVRQSWLNFNAETAFSTRGRHNLVILHSFDTLDVQHALGVTLLALMGNFDWRVNQVGLFFILS